MRNAFGAAASPRLRWRIVRHPRLARAVFLALLAPVLPVVFLTQAFAPSPAFAASKVVAIGDSWGAMLPPFLDTQFKSHGHDDYDVLNIAVPGATAAAYAGNVGGVLDLSVATIAATPEAEYVFISLGGNDLAGGYPALGDGVFAQIESDLRTVVDRILAARPTIQIVMAGYDVLKFDKSDFCLALAYTQFAKVLPWEVTPLFLEIGARQKAVDDSYANVTYLSLWGTGQGTPGSPNLLAWSPSSYVADPAEDCLHLSDAGNTQFAAQIYNSYFAPRISPSCGALVSPSPMAGGGGLIPLGAPLAVAGILKFLRGRARPAA